MQKDLSHSNHKSTILDFNDFMDKCLEVAESQVILIIPVNKIYSSMQRLRRIKKYGAITQIHYVGSGREFGFPFGFSVGAVQIVKGAKCALCTGLENQQG